VARVLEAARGVSRRNPQPAVHSITLTAWLSAGKRRSIEVLERGAVVLHERKRTARFRTVNAAAAALFLQEVIWQLVPPVPRAGAAALALGRQNRRRGRGSPGR